MISFEIVVIIFIFMALWSLGVAFMKHDLIDEFIEKRPQKYQKAIKIFINFPLVGLAISIFILFSGMICGILIILLYPVEMLSKSFKR